MSTTQRYHHGDLRAALIRTALEAFERGGAESVSLRGLAEATGVSRSAPYSHFQNKRALMAAIAEVGFERFVSEMLHGAETATDPRTRFLGVGQGYLRFALKNPSLFKLMFSAELARLKGVGDLESKSERAYAVFQQGLDAFLQYRGEVTPASLILQTLCWSSVHGLALLLLEDRLPGRPDEPMDLGIEVTSLFADLVEAWLQSDQ